MSCLFIESDFIIASSYTDTIIFYSYFSSPLACYASTFSKIVFPSAFMSHVLLYSRIPSPPLSSHRFPSYLHLCVRAHTSTYTHFMSAMWISPSLALQRMAACFPLDEWPKRPKARALARKNSALSQKWLLVTVSVLVSTTLTQRTRWTEI